MEYWIEAEGVGHYFFYAFPIVLILLFVLLRERRVRFLIPSLVITAVIVNPLFFKYWDKTGVNSYWRSLWIIPVVPVVAALVPAVTEKVDIIDRNENKSWIGNVVKCLIALAGIVGIVFGGSFVYKTERGQFVAKNANSSKLPEYVEQIADKLMKLGGGEDNRIRIIAQDPIGVYIRQYNGEIDTLFGRDVGGYIYKSQEGTYQINKTLSEKNKDISMVSQFMLDENYDYLVVAGEERTMDDFELVEHVNMYDIFRPMIIRKSLVPLWNKDMGEAWVLSADDCRGMRYRDDIGIRRKSIYTNNGLMVF